jgi:hypothetical protein
VSWPDAGPVVTAVVRCGPVVRGPHVAPMGPGLVRSRLVVDACDAPVLRDQGPDRLAGHARPMQTSNVRPGYWSGRLSVGRVALDRLDALVASAADPRWCAALPRQRRMILAVKPQQENVCTGATVVPLMASSREVATAFALMATAAMPMSPPEIWFLEV